MRTLKYIIFALLIGLISGCYSFKGISIPPEAESFYVKDFVLRANNAPAQIDQLWSEALREKIRNESRLTYNEKSPDIEFEGSIISYKVIGTAPQAGNTVSLNKLTIGVNVTYINNAGDGTKDNEWTQSFSFFKDFDATLDLNSVEEGFIEEIFEQLTENVFNKAFTNW